MYALRPPHVDAEQTGLFTHECDPLMSFAIFVGGLLRTTWSGDHQAYQVANMGAKGRALQSFHRDMMKIPDDKRAVSLFAMLNEELCNADGNESVFLPHSRNELPRP